jgi:hypothetical protein
MQGANRAAALGSALILCGCLHGTRQLNPPIPTDAAHGAEVENWYSYYAPTRQPAAPLTNQNPVVQGVANSEGPCAQLVERVLNPVCAPAGPDISTKYFSADLALGMESAINQELNRVRELAPQNGLNYETTWVVLVENCSSASPTIMVSASYSSITGIGTICISPYFVKALFYNSGAPNLGGLQSIYLQAGVDPLTFDGAFAPTLTGYTKPNFYAVESTAGQIYDKFVAGVDYVLARELARATMPSRNGQAPTETAIESATDTIFKSVAGPTNVQPVTNTLAGILKRYGAGTWGFETVGDSGQVLIASQASPN